MRRPLAFFWLFLAASLLTRAPFLDVPLLDLDEAAHVVGSWELLRGGRLYTDFADNKPPLLYAYYALAQMPFGRGLPAVRLFTALLVLPLTALALSAFFRHDRRGLAAGLLYLVYGAAFLAHDMHAAHAEVVFLLPAAWALVLVRDDEDGARLGRLFASGLVLGVATLVKQHAAAWLIVPALAARSFRSPLPSVPVRFLTLLAGFAVPLLAAWLAFAASGGAADFVYWTLTWNLRYAANPITAAEGLLRAARGPLPFLLATAPLWWLAWRSRQALDGGARRTVVGLLLAVLASAIVGFRFYPHYLIPLYVPLALAAAPEAARLALPPRSRAGWGLLAYSLLLLVGFTAANHVLYRIRTDVYEETSPLYDRVRAVLATDPAFHGGSLFVWGFAPGFYAHLPELRPASRFVVVQSSLTGYVAGNTASARGEVDARHLIVDGHWDALLADLERARATFILDTSPSGLHRWNNFPLQRFPRLEQYVRDGYRQVADVDGVRIYRRR